MWNSTNRWRKLALSLVCLGVLVMVACSILVGVSTYEGHVSWFHRLSGGVVVVSGHSHRGRVDMGPARDVLIVTADLNGRGVSYWITFPVLGRAMAWNCGTWTPPFLPVYVVTNNNPPCLFHSEVEGNAAGEALVSRPLRSVSFSGTDGSKWTANW